MGKILIIGSSYSIKDTFSKKFFDKNVSYIGFREAWKKKDIGYHDKIILSGFHHDFTKYSFKKLNAYINDYCNFIERLTKKSDKILLICTYVPKQISFSRVVFFYYNISKNLINNNSINIISFKKILDNNFKNSTTYKILKLFKFKFTDQHDLINNTEIYFLKKVNKPRFFFIFLKRIMFLERISRLFDID
tara:strand:- start:572 stop:1144 length:573 start_codon:yes stop_codon:yes gene_type:complete